MRAAIYARRSTMKDSQADTIENQVKICQRKADELGLIVVDVKEDTASGTVDTHREEVKELIQDAIDGKYDCVIMKGVSRFYRDTEDGLRLIKRLDRSKIRIVTVEEGFDSSKERTSTGKLDTSKITMYLMFAEMESKKTADRVKHTQIEKAHAGEWNQAGSIPFGYVYNKTTKKLDVESVNANIIKLIFKLYLDGMGMRSIAQYLNGDNPESKEYLSPKGKRWSPYTVGFILKNKVYLGYVVYNKRSKNERPYKNPASIGKTDDDIYIGNDYNEKEDWIITKDAHERIVSDEVFKRAQEIRKTKGVRSGIRNNISLLAGIAKCGKCGAGMTFKRGNRNSKGQINTRNNYYCSDYIKYGTRYCTSHHVRAEDFEELVIGRLQEIVTKTLDYQKTTSGIRQKEHNNDKIEREMAKNDRNMTQIGNKMDILLGKNIEGDISDNQFNMMNKRYTDELNALVEQSKKLKEDLIKAGDSEDKTDFLKRKYDEVRDIESYPKERKRYLLLDLISKLTVNEGEIEIEYAFKTLLN